MPTVPVSLHAALAAWNERDPDRIRPHLGAALAPNVGFADPDNFAEGVDAFEAAARKFRADRPNAELERTCRFNGHRRRYGLDGLASSDGVAAVAGVDVAKLNELERVVRIDGFFGPILKRKTAA